jgi:hypothetical protein
LSYITPTLSCCKNKTKQKQTNNPPPPPPHALEKIDLGCEFWHCRPESVWLSRLVLDKASLNRNTLMTRLLCSDWLLENVTRGLQASHPVFPPEGDSVFTKLVALWNITAVNNTSLGMYLATWNQICLCNMASYLLLYLWNYHPD